MKATLVPIGVAIVVWALVVLGWTFARNGSDMPSDARPAEETVVADREPADSRSPTEVDFLPDPQLVEDFSVEDLEGRVLVSANWRDRITIVNFWATWCAPCLVEIPDFVELRDQFAGRLEIIGLSVDDLDTDAVRQFAAEHGITYPIAMATTDLEAAFGGIVGLPTSFIVDPAGRVVQKHVGLKTRDLYEREVEALLSGPGGGTDITTEGPGQ